MINIEWSKLKQFILSNNASVQYVDFDNEYFIIAIDGGLQFGCNLSKTSTDTTDLLDFETNFKSEANKKISQRDSENSLIVRSKQAPTGWHYHAHSFEFSLSSLNSDICLNESGNDFGFTSMKFYNAAGEEITNQSIADTDCVKTVLDWEPNFDFEILSGKLYFKEATLNEPVRLWVIGAPDIPKESGGSRCFANGINLDFLDVFQPIETDGRVSKHMPYDSVYHSNKFRFILRHNPGKKLDIMFILEIYRA